MERFARERNLLIYPNPTYVVMTANKDENLQRIVKELFYPPALSGLTEEEIGMLANHMLEYLKLSDGAAPGAKK